MRQGGDPRLPLELALVKVTRPGGRPLARVARLPARAARAARPQRPRAGRQPAERRRRARREDAAAAGPAAPEPPVRSSSPSSRRPGSGRVLPAVEQRSIPAASVSGGAPVALADDVLDARVPAGQPTSTASWPRSRRTRRCSSEALYEVTGRQLARRVRGRRARAKWTEADEPAGEEDIVALVKETFDAREVERSSQWRWT